MRSFCATSGAQTVVCYAVKGAPAATSALCRNGSRLDASLAFRGQCEGDLGHRLKAAFSASFERQGSEGGSSGKGVVVVDIPEISAKVLEKAFETLCDRNNTLLPPQGQKQHHARE